MNEGISAGRNLEREIDDRTVRDSERIAAALRGLRYGEVTVVVQDGVVIRLERTEKIRIVRRQARQESAGVTEIR